MKKHVLVVVIVLSCFLIVSLIGCAKTAPTTPAATTPKATTAAPTTLAATTSKPTTPTNVIKWKHFQYQDHSISVIDSVYKKWRDEVNTATNGALVIEKFMPGEHPYVGADLPRALSEGACQVADFYPGYWSATEPVPIVASLPMLMPPDYAVTRQLYDEINEKYLQPIWAKWKGISVATWWFPGHGIAAPVPVTSWDALKGRKIRATGLEAAELLKLLGANPITMPMPDVPSALATGLLEGCMFNPLTLWTAKFGEYKCMRYFTFFEALNAPTSIVINKDALAALPENVRNTLLAVTKKWEPTMRISTWDEDCNAARMASIRYGVTLVAPSADFRQEVTAKAESVIWSAWLGRSGTQGKEALDYILKRLKELGYRK